MHDLTFNAKKSVCMFFRSSVNKQCGLSDIFISSTICEFANEVKYLGVMINSSFKTTIDVQRQTRFLYTANLLIRNFRYWTDTITVDVINEELSKICDWLGANKLSFNIVKTKYMLYHSINKRVIYPKLKINNNNIDRITQFNFLGVILHERMSWKQHIEHIRLKIAKTIGIIYRLKSIYPSAILLTLYNTLVTPHLHYCLLCWGSIIKENDLLHIMQKRVLIKDNY